MSENMRRNCFVSAIIVAAGKSTRMNMKLNKQFIYLNNVPVLAHTLKAFNDNPIIDEILLVVNKNDISFVTDSIINKYSFIKVSNIVVGGSDRQSSVYNGIKAASTQSDIIIIHDGSRPFVSSDIILNTILAAQEFSSSLCAVKVKDTIKTSSEEGFINKTLDRDSLRSIQTPQAFFILILFKKLTIMPFLLVF